MDKIKKINRNTIISQYEECVKIDEEVTLESEITGRIIELSENEATIYIRSNRGLSKNSNVFFTNKLAITNLPKINPLERKPPNEIIHTGISAIDLLVTVVKGQKLPIFTSSGINVNDLLYQLITQVNIPNIVFIGLGITKQDELFFRQNLRKAHLFINKATDSASERLLLPNKALSEAEKISETEDVLVIIKDMTNYCNSLREFSLEMGELPSRKGYPSYMYSNLARIYERAGIFKNRKGSLTLIPIVTMPNDDISHPIPDLTGFITEGQIVLKKGLPYPFVDPLPSLSRLMKDVIKKEHAEISNRLFAAYSKVHEIRDLAYIVGEEALTEDDKKYLEFGQKFEKSFLAQEEYESRTLKESLTIAKGLLGIL
ncbi:MAG: V-type ATP synthase subunit B [Defluviitaleaceae bacterium]|nr:V-type ATP synthase subunit B [Defluviitaleaceae bacterium]